MCRTTIRLLCDPKPCRRRRYRSALTDTAWARIARFLVPEHPRGGRPCPADHWHEYLDASLYVLRTGCAWRHLPHDVTVHWSAAHKHFLRWSRDGTLSRMLAAIRSEVRARSGRRRRPTAAVVDSSSVKAPPVAGPRGFDGVKKVDAVKRHILVDSAGLLVASRTTLLLRRLDRSQFFDTL